MTVTHDLLEVSSQVIELGDITDKKSRRKGSFAVRYHRDEPVPGLAFTYPWGIDIDTNNYWDNLVVFSFNVVIKDFSPKKLSNFKDYCATSIGKNGETTFYLAIPVDIFLNKQVGRRVIVRFSLRHQASLAQRLKQSLLIHRFNYLTAAYAIFLLFLMFK